MRNGGAAIPRDHCRRLTRPPHRTASACISSPGVRYAEEMLRGRWLVALILLHQHQPAFSDVGRQSWRLSRPRGGATPTKARLVCADEGGHVLLDLTVRTDFPAPGIEILFEGGALFLPSEDWRPRWSTAGRMGSRTPWLADMLQRPFRRATGGGTALMTAAHRPPPA